MLPRAFQAEFAALVAREAVGGTARVLTNYCAAKQGGVGHGRGNGWLNSRTALRNARGTKGGKVRRRALPTIFDGSSSS